MCAEKEFDPAKAKAMATGVLDAIIAGAPFAAAKLDIWTSAVAEGCLRRLASLQLPFKYAVTCRLEQRAGAGLHAAAGGRLCAGDGVLAVQWHNPSVSAVVIIAYAAI